MRLQRIVFGVMAYCAAGWLAAAPLVLTPEEEAGRQIYTRGTSPSGERISARVGIGPLDVAGVAVACANCHGPDGLGRPEGGIVPPNIVWSELVKPYGHNHPSGRKHAAFDETSVPRAVRDGVDPAGNQLDRAMPRFRMSDGDLRALVAYMKKLELQQDPGIQPASVRFGTVLPLAGRLGELGRSVQAVLEAAFDSVNRNGGVFGRKLELVVADAGESAEATSAAAGELIRNGDVFALIAPFTPRLEMELGPLTDEARIPVLAPLTAFAGDTAHGNPYVFHLFSGVAELAQVLGRHGAVAHKLSDRQVVLLDGGDGATLAETTEAALRALGYNRIARLDARRDAADLAAELKARDAGAVWVLGGGADLAALARAAERVGVLPHLMLPGPLAPRDILDLAPAFQGRVHLAYPTLPTDQSESALRGYEAVLAGREVARARGAVPVAAFSAALLAAETLARAGRDLNRQRFVGALEAVDNFSTGLTPRLSYAAHRRIGALGGYVVDVDLAQRTLRPASGWISLQ